ncbi:RNA 2',3'-cyclic phosphodiesterase [Paenibacillus sp. TAB 01]|uniref:RNA 2',3'-cyclic phosphodiesterase n=1 Tax=Paenibacillus sp. TAB 01 TaxID=3368988 RepID=UPI00375010D4
MTMERLFVALPLGIEQRRLLERQQQTLQEQVPFQKWTHPDDLHLTLKFLGDTPADTAHRIPSLLEPISNNHAAFQLTLHGLGFFGKPNEPSILWAGVQGDFASLRALQQDVESAMETIGFVREQREYNPHITLARRYRGASAFTAGTLAPHIVIDNAEEGLWRVDSLVLYRTHLGRRPSYEPAAAFPLK